MIVVFGSLNMDMLMPVDQFPSVGETKLISQMFYSPGGKGANQAVAAARSGAAVSLFGTLGNDSFGEHIAQALAQEKMDISGVTRGDLPTGSANVWVNAAGENCILVASGANLEARSRNVSEALLTPETILLLQMEVPPEENWKLVKRAAAKGARVILNLAPASKIPPEILPLLYGVIVNEGEAQQLARSLDLEYTHPMLFGQWVSRTYGPWICITRGAQETLLCTAETTWTAPVLKITPLDTTAAGDTFVGVFSASLSLGVPLPECLHRAVVAGGLACLGKGAVSSIPWMSEILSTGKMLAAPEQWENEERDLVRAVSYA